MTNRHPRRPLREALAWYRGRRVLVTGHNGFVGSWLTSVLVDAGAEVTGLSLPPAPGGIGGAIGLADRCTDLEGDIRDAALVHDVVAGAKPDVVFHLAAQPLVLPSFDAPLETFSTNVMGTAHVLEAIRLTKGIRACVVITSDKCYATADEPHAESDPLGGDDPYSASKGAAEIVVHAYRHSFFAGGPPLASARAGNIIGGGDVAAHRIVPDIVRAIGDGEAVRLRRPDAVRPWQHVLDAVGGYAQLGEALATRGAAVAEAWNFGPDADSAMRVDDLVRRFLSSWRELGGTAKDAEIDAAGGPPERGYLTLVSDKARNGLGWAPAASFDDAVTWTAEWYFRATSPEAARAVTSEQIAAYLDRVGA